MKKKASHHQKDVVIAEIDAKTNNIIEKGDKEMAKKVTKKEEIKSQDEYIVTIKELVDAGYIVTINDDVKDPRNQSSMLGVKIKLSYDETLDKVYAEIV